MVELVDTQVSKTCPSGGDGSTPSLGIWLVTYGNLDCPPVNYYEAFQCEYEQALERLAELSKDRRWYTVKMYQATILEKKGDWSLKPGRGSGHEGYTLYNKTPDVELVFVHPHNKVGPMRFYSLNNEAEARAWIDRFGKDMFGNETYILARVVKQYQWLIPWLSGNP
jgi:hypothetical protein